MGIVTFEAGAETKRYEYAVLRLTISCKKSAVVEWAATAAFAPKAGIP